MANGDVTKTMTPSTGATVVMGNNGTGGGNNNASADIVYWGVGGFIPPTSGTANKVTVTLGANLTGKMKCALYSDNAGNPGSLLTQTVEVTNPITGDNDFTFLTPPTLTDSGVYWLAIWTNAAFTFTTGGGSQSYWVQQLYNYATNSGNFPATAVPTAIALYSQYARIRATITVANFGMLNELHMNSDTDYVFSATPNDLDVYDLQDLTVNPANIPLVVTKVAMRKSDTGFRTACSQIKSGGTTQDLPTVNLAVTYGWQMGYLTTDPNTTAAWTQAGVNNFKLGVKVVA